MGVARTKAITFPLAFLAFALPIPLGVTENLHLALRHVATAGTAAVMPLLGIPVFVEGTTLHMARGALQVADACSGFSTLYAAMAVAFLTAYSTPSATRRAMVLVGAAPIAVTSNLLRVILLVVLTVTEGPEILDTWVHPASGMMTFALSLPLIFWLGGPSGAARPALQPAEGRS
jgi:exosortase